MTGEYLVRDTPSTAYSISFSDSPSTASAVICRYLPPSKTLCAILRRSVAVTGPPRRLQATYPATVNARRCMSIQVTAPLDGRLQATYPPPHPAPDPRDADAGAGLAAPRHSLERLRHLFKVCATPPCASVPTTSAVGDGPVPIPTASSRCARRRRVVAPGGGPDRRDTAAATAAAAGMYGRDTASRCSMASWRRRRGAPSGDALATHRNIQQAGCPQRAAVTHWRPMTHQNIQQAGCPPWWRRHRRPVAAALNLPPQR